MKKLLLLLSVLFVVSCSKEEVCEPIPTMGSSTLNEAGYSSISVSGTITPPTCDVSIISQGFVLDDEQLPTISKMKKIVPGTSILAVFEGLTPNTTYFVRTFLTNVDGDYYGPQVEIKTQNPSVNFSETGVEQSFESAIFSTKYSFAEGAGLNVKTKGFEIDGQDYPDSDSANGIISVSVDGLNVNKSYTYKAYVQTEYGYYTSDEKSFSTNDPSSLVTNLEVNASFIESLFSAKYSNSYQGDDITTETGFYFSKNEDFSPSRGIISEASNKEFSRLAQDLYTDTKYFVKAYVKNPYGTYTSDVISFETLNAGYNFSNISASEIDYENAQLNSNYTQIFNGDKIDIAQKGLYISNNEDMSSSRQYVFESTVDGIIIIPLEGLKTNVKYYYQFFINNAYGFFRSEISNFVTKSAVPEFSFDVIDETIWFDKTKANFSMTKPDDVSITSFNIDIKNLNTEETTRINYLENYSDYSGGAFEYEMTDLHPNTNYTVKMILENPYGTFESDNYSFTTKDDTPFMKSFNVNTEPNQIQYSYNINPVDGDLVNRIYLKYKNNEEEDYITVNLENTTNSTTNWNIDNQSIYIENIVQGPEYEYILHYENEWNTHTYTSYDTKNVEYKVGDIKFGGVIVYIDASGYHGLISAEAKYFKKLSWASDIETSNDLDIPIENSDSGESNTKLIIDYYSKIDATAPAAEYCNDFESGGYTDWYLPSYRDLKYIKPALWNKYSGGVMGSIDNNWTSNNSGTDANGAGEDKAIGAFYNGCSGSESCPRNYKKTEELYTFPIRKF